MTTSGIAVLTIQGTDDIAVTGLQCSLDNVQQDPLACGTNPVVVENLQPGTHFFQTSSVDSAGNIDTTPAIFSWNVVPGDQVLVDQQIPTISTSITTTTISTSITTTTISTCNYHNNNFNFNYHNNNFNLNYHNNNFNLNYHNNNNEQQYLQPYQSANIPQQPQQSYLMPPIDPFQNQSSPPSDPFQNQSSIITSTPNGVTPYNQQFLQKQGQQQPQITPQSSILNNNLSSSFNLSSSSPFPSPPPHFNHYN